MRRFTPRAYTEYGCGMYSDEEYSVVKMEESKDGMWVPYENATHTVKMLTKQIERLKKENMKLKKTFEE